MVVTFISLLVHIYSTDYVNGDRRYTHYYAFLALFTASMLFFVLAENTLQMIVGWELVGVCSFVLIGHWWEEKPNSDAALKAFLTNRVGDMGLIIGVIILFFAAGQTFDILDINIGATNGAISHTTCSSPASLLPHRRGDVEVGPVHPPHVAARRHGRPDAGVGADPRRDHGRGRHLHGRPPVPGVLRGPVDRRLARSTLLAVVGAVTALFGALLAFVQKDIKKVLAYSTVSASSASWSRRSASAPGPPRCSTSSPTPCSRPACSSGAGSLSHAAGHSFNMVDDMGGLRKKMPSTFWTYLIAHAGAVGHLPAGGLLVEGRDPRRHRRVAGTSGPTARTTSMLVMLLLAAFCTAAYMIRTIWYAFYGEYQGPRPRRTSPVRASRCR